MNELLFIFKPIRCLLITFLVVAINISAQQNSEQDQLLEVLVSEKGNVGVSAGYAVDGEVIWSNGAGYLCEGGNVEFTDSTLTRIASIAKTMTAVAIMQLVENGKIDLDAPIQTYLPDFPKKEKGDITTRNLITHSSGISGYKGKKEMENMVEYPSLQEAMNVFQDRPLQFKPGSQYAYSSYAYVVLGRIIEVVSGMDYETYMRENIWNKAGMNNTGIERFGMNYQNKACLYQREKNKTKSANQNNLSNRVPGGGFYSTLKDVLKFGKALVDGVLISDKTLKMMMESQAIKSNGNAYGMGWFFYAPAPHENLVIGHSGGQTGCTSQLMIIPKSKTVVAVLSNTSGTYPDVVNLASDLIQISER